MIRSTEGYWILHPAGRTCAGQNIRFIPNYLGPAYGGYGTFIAFFSAHEASRPVVLCHLTVPRTHTQKQRNWARDLHSLLQRTPQVPKADDFIIFTSVTLAFISRTRGHRIHENHIIHNINNLNSPEGKMRNKAPTQKSHRYYESRSRSVEPHETYWKPERAGARPLRLSSHVLVSTKSRRASKSMIKF